MKIIKLESGELVQLKKVVAQCNFCGEDNKECVRGSIPVTVSFPTYKTERGRKIDDWKYSIFGYKIIVGDWGYRDFVVEEKLEEKKDHADICDDCVKQLAALISENNPSTPAV